MEEAGHFEGAPLDGADGEVASDEQLPLLCVALYALYSPAHPHVHSIMCAPIVLLHTTGTREGQQLTQSSIRTFVREGTEVYMDKLEGTNSWADMLDAVSRPGNGAVADRLTRVFVREMVTSYFRRPREPETRWLPAPSRLHDHIPMIGSRCLSYCSAGFGRAGSSHKVACHSVLCDFVWLAICLGATTGPGKGVLSSLLGRR